MRTEAMKRAKRGDRLLVKVDPEYWKKIDLTKLDVGSTKDCILGQVFGDSDKGLQELGLKTDGEEYGFDSGAAESPKYTNETYVEYDELYRAWVQIIAKHKGC